MKVLLAVDGSPCSEAAVNEVATRPWPTGSQVRIVTAYELIVLGSHGYGAWHRFLLGSVSQAVVSHAKCSVEVVRSHDVAQKKLAA